MMQIKALGIIDGNDEDLSVMIGFCSKLLNLTQ